MSTLRSIRIDCTHDGTLTLHEALVLEVVAYCITSTPGRYGFLTNNDGTIRPWAQRSIAFIHRHTPYLSKQQVRNAVDRLVALGFLERRKFEGAGAAYWYALPE